LWGVSSPHHGKLPEKMLWGKSEYPLKNGGEASRKGQPSTRGYIKKTPSATCGGGRTSFGYIGMREKGWENS